MSEVPLCPTGKIDLCGWVEIVHCRWLTVGYQVRN
jgi:hypothetical protein